VSGAAPLHTEAEQAASASVDWPQWRGPLGTGVAPASGAPVRFSATEGVRWRTAIPGRGNSSPVVWEDLVFVTTAVPVEERPQGGDRPRRRRPSLLEHEFRLLALRRGDGTVAWSSTATVATPHEGYHRTMSSYANPSPVTNGRQVYAFFGSRGLYAFDFDGEPLWQRDFDVQMQTYGQFGEAASPALHGDTLVVVFDHQGQSFIEAVDSSSGATRWKRLRDEDTSWSSPYVVEHGGRALVVASGGNHVTAYELTTGDAVWRASGMTPNPIPTPVAGGGLLFAASGSTERHVLAIDLDARTDGAAAIVWRLDKAAPYNPSPLLWDEQLYLVRDGGMNAGTSRLSLLNARTGEAHYLQERLPGSYSVKASPVGAAGHVYLATEEGDVLVIRRSPDFEVVAANPMGEPFIASPAIAHDQLYLRGRTHLFAIGR
jgi:outer membrane protein assembly factor BamB